MTPLRIGYVGCGFIAQAVHLPNIRLLQSEGLVELVALAEQHRPELGEKVRAAYNVPVLHRTHTHLIADPRVEAVAVSAHYAAQGEVAKDALLAGKPVFMEKPMACSVAQGESILDAERAGGGRLMVAYMKRYDAGYELFRRLVRGFVESDELGPMLYTRAHGFCGDWLSGAEPNPLTSDEPRPAGPDRSPDWLPEAHRKGYLGYLQMWCHNLNLLRWVLDAGPVDVDGVFLDDDGLTGVAVMHMAGRRTVMETALTQHTAWDEHVQVYFRGGWVRAESPPLLLDGGRARVQVYRGGDKAGIEEPIPSREDGRWDWSYRRELRHFVACVRNGEPFRSDGADALHDIRALEAIYRQHLATREA